VSVKKKADNPYRTTKKPLTPNGFKDASTDKDAIKAWWDKNPEAHPGVDMGRSGLIGLDLDVKRSSDGTVEIDGFENFTEQWLDFPDTFNFESVSGAGGSQYIYAAPPGKNLGPSQNYRGILGVDTRAGGSYSVFTAAPKSRKEFTPAPEWLCDERPERDLSQYSGSIQDWFEALTPGSPSVAVKSALTALEKAFLDGGMDLTHEQIVGFQHRRPPRG